MSEVTRILSAIENGDPDAARELLPLVYDELRRLAAQWLVQEAPGQTLQATALVHDAYLRLVGDERPPQWNGRAHFFGAAAEAMRRILVEHARRKGRLKRGGDWRRREVPTEELTVEGPNTDLLDLDEALSQLAREHPPKAQLVKLRYFAGLTLAEAASALGVSTATAERHWRYARAWLARRLRQEDGGGEAP